MDDCSDAAGARGDSGFALGGVLLLPIVSYGNGCSGFRTLMARLRLPAFTDR